VSDSLERERKGYPHPTVTVKRMKLFYFEFIRKGKQVLCRTDQYISIESLYKTSKSTLRRKKPLSKRMFVHDFITEIPTDRQTHSGLSGCCV